MNRFSPLFALPLALGGAAAAVVLAPVQAQAQAQQPLDQQAMAKAAAAEETGQLQYAADQYAQIEKDFPTSVLIPQATLRLGYVFFRLGNYDKAIEKLDAGSKLKTASPDLVELALSLLPQVQSAKAAGLKADNPARNAGFEEAVKGFDSFLTKYPNSAEFESANYGKGVALYQLAKYDEAAKALQVNLQKFPKSDTILDSLYLLGLTQATQANLKAQASQGKDAGVPAAYDLAEKTLRSVNAAGSDVALANDSRYQIGELLFNRAGFLDPNDKKARETAYHKALDAFRQVLGKDIIVAVQKARVEYWKGRKLQAYQARDFEAATKKIPRVIDREGEKLATIESHPDQTLVARVKSGEIYFHLERFDEARVLLNYIKDLAAEEDKKEVVYYIALSLASQNARTVETAVKAARNAGQKDEEAIAAAKTLTQPLTERAEAAYGEFKSDFKNDPIAENLALVMGLGFTDTEPEKAIKYFQESSADYPKGQFRLTALSQEASSMLRLKRYDEALKAFQNTLDQKPEKAIAANAEYGIASAYQAKKELTKAIPAFKKVRDTYDGLPEAENASFWYGQLLGETGQNDQAAKELTAFIEKYPKSPMKANALFYKGAAQKALTAAASGPDHDKFKEAAIATYKELTAEPFKKQEVAPYSYIQRGQIYLADKEYDKTIEVMEELTKAHPDWNDIYQAYDLRAQLHATLEKPDLQIADYMQFVKDKPQDPKAAVALLKVSDIYRARANKLGRYVGLKQEDKDLWEKYVTESVKAARQLIRECSKSPEVSPGIAALIEADKMQQQPKGKTTPKDVEEAVSKDLDELAAELNKAGETSAASKVRFAMATAAYPHTKDKAAALKRMAEAFIPAEKYAPGDLDAYGMALIEQGKLEEAGQIYSKIGTDYPLPSSGQAPVDIQEAQSIRLFGEGKILQEQKKDVEAGKVFAELEKLYAWSPKNLEGNYGIAASLRKQKKTDDASKRLMPIITSRTAPPELRGKAMLLLAGCLEDEGKFEAAIDNYMKIGVMFPGLPKIAAEGLWHGANLMEKQGTGEIPMPKPPAKATPKPAVKK